MNTTGLTLLRKLTRKSLLKFGQHHDKCVQELLNRHKKKYLRWVYYNCSMITFVDDILQEIHCFDYQIEKPGKYPILGHAIDFKIENYHTTWLSKLKREAKRRKKIRLESTSVQKKQMFSKGKNKSFNNKIIGVPNTFV